MSLIFSLFRRPPTRTQRELAYLAEAVSRYDLELREREVAAGRFAGF